MARKTHADLPSPPQPFKAKSAVRVSRSQRGELLRSLEGAADFVRDQPWPAASRNKALQEAVPYDRDRAAKAILKLEDFGGLDAKNRKTLLTYTAALASHLPESLEDLDGTAVLEWLERERAIEWKDDLLSVPAAERDALIAIIESRLAAADRGAMPQDVGRDLARSLALVLPLAVGTKEPEAQVQRIEETLVQFLITWLWQAKGIEHAVAERAVDELAQVLQIQWVSPPRPEPPYSSQERFQVGDSLFHSKFGRGTVVSRTDTAIEVRFAAGSRRLAAG